MAREDGFSLTGFAKSLRSRHSNLILSQNHLKNLIRWPEFRCLKRGRRLGIDGNFNLTPKFWQVPCAFAVGSSPPSHPAPQHPPEDRAVPEDGRDRQGVSRQGSGCAELGRTGIWRTWALYPGGLRERLIKKDSCLLCYQGLRKHSLWNSVLLPFFPV